MKCSTLFSSCLALSIVACAPEGGQRLFFEMPAFLSVDEKYKVTVTAVNQLDLLDQPDDSQPTDPVKVIDAAPLTIEDSDTPTSCWCWAGDFEVPVGTYDLTLNISLTEPFARSIAKDVQVIQDGLVTPMFGDWEDLVVDSDGDLGTDFEELKRYGTDPSVGCVQAPPPGMTTIGPLCIFIDLYESTVFDDPSCTGTRYGENSDDYPAGFPDLVESANCEGECAGHTTEAQTTPLYACPIKAIIPSRHVTWFQAKRACENVGKYLCSYESMGPACYGPSRNHVSGRSPAPSPCNVRKWRGPVLEIAKTGEYPDCTTEWGGFDILGNLGEWVDCNWGTADIDEKCYLSNSFANRDQTPLRCDSDKASVSSTAADRGFRCCKD